MVISRLASSFRMVDGEMDMSSNSVEENMKVSHRRCVVSDGEFGVVHSSLSGKATQIGNCAS